MANNIIERKLQSTMSASREKKARQEQGGEQLTPKQQKALEEQKANRRTTAIFSVCAVLFLLGVAAMFVWNTNIIQRNAAAASVNGQTFTAADMAYYYYNSRANLLNNNTSLDTSTSLRNQAYTSGSQYDTWYDYLAQAALKSLSNATVTAQAAKDAGFDGGEEVEKSVKENMDSLDSAAASAGYTSVQYLKGVFGPLMTRSVFERNLRTAMLANAYASHISDTANYSADELEAQRAADPKAYEMAEYESIVFPSSSFATEATDTTEANDGSAAALAAAQEALARYQAGEDLEALATELKGTYMSTASMYSTGSDMVDWLFDDARKDGDADVLDYSYYGTSIGSAVMVFHSEGLADYHTVSVRHILVADEAKANELLAQFNAGDKTEDAFAALATENSTDSGSKENGGLLANVQRGQTVKPFDAWCFDTSRQIGDTGIVQSTYGYHVIYFVGRSDYAYWQDMAASKLGSEKLSSITDFTDTSLLDGMKYIDR